MKWAAIFIISLLLCACATTSTHMIPKDMKVATADSVKPCTLLGDIHGVSGLYGVFAESGLSGARQQAFEQARSLGANTVVWGPFATPYGSTSVSGLAYLCPTDVVSHSSRDYYLVIRREMSRAESRI